MPGPPDFLALFAGAELRDDGSVAYRGYVVPAGAAQYDDLRRIESGDPKAPYLILSRGGAAP